MIELLAPVGSREALVAAVESGADAVYMGGKAFGARHYAPNFTDEELAAAIRFAHLRGVRVYVTVNILVDNDEIPSLTDYLRYLYRIGTDAIIVQDVGVAAIAKQVAPGLAIHASTQMTIHNLAGAKMLAEKGFDRVVLARELSLEDIGRISEQAGLEVETFIHGALCISYSGQCLMSSMIGGRSGNRGRCAQPCRLPYKLVDSAGQDVLADAEAGEYILSPRDLNTIELIPELISRGVSSFKIEGRMKRPEYVAVVVSTYRRAIDACLLSADGYTVTADDHKDLAQVFNRDFTSVYLKGRPGRNMMSDRRPNNRGIRIGRIMSYDYPAKTAVIKLDEEIAVGDMLEIWVKVGGRVSVNVSSITVNGRNVSVAAAGETVTVPAQGTGIRPSDRVFRTFDARLMEKARSFFQSPSALHRIPVDVVVTASAGKPLTVTMTDGDGHTGTGMSEFIAQTALNRPLTEETVRKQIDRLGTTIFELRSLICHLGENIMVPISEINEARRHAVDTLEADRLKRWERPTLPTINFPMSPLRTIKPTKPELAVCVDSIPGVEEAAASGADWIIFGGESFRHQPFTPQEYRQAADICRTHQIKLQVNTPRLLRDWQVDGLTRELELFAELEPAAVGVGNLGTLWLIAARFPSLHVHGEFSLNVFNSVAVDFFRQAGVASVTLSPELTFSQIENITARSAIPLECIVHGHLPLMISEYCTIGSFLGNVHKGSCNQACIDKSYWLKDRKGEIFPLATDQFCRMHVLNAKELNMTAHIGKFGSLGISRIRIEAKKEEAAAVGRVTRLYRELLDQGEGHALLQQSAQQKADNTHITRGHYFRGVL